MSDETAQEEGAERPRPDEDISYAQFRALANSIPNLAWMARPDGWIFWYNQRWYDYTKTTPEEMMGWGWQAVHHPDVLPEMLENWTEALRTGEPFQMTFPLRRGSDGSFRIFFTRAEPLKENGQLVGWFGTNTDITEQEPTRERLQLVINELNHRVKNTLATVHSIAIGSFKHSDDVALDSFERRLLSLAQVHELLARDSWTATSIAEVIRTIAASFDEERFEVHPCEIRVEPRVASALAMTLHELGTNAAKYGALSNDSGHVRIHCEAQRQNGASRAVIDWSEHGGPPAEAPQFQGFGLRLIRRAMATESGATVEHAFGPEGVTCRIVVPFSDGHA